MRIRASAFAAAVLLVAASAPSPAWSARLESLLELADLFAEQGLDPLPGQSSLLVEGGIVGVFPGSPREGDDKPYILVTASPPAGMAAVGALVDVGGGGADFDGRPLPPLLDSLGRHVIVAYFEDPADDGEGIIPLESVAASIDLSALYGGSGMSVRIHSAASSPVWMRLIEQSNIPLGLDLEVEESPDLDSARATAFYGREIPGLQFAAGAVASQLVGEPRYIPASILAASIAAKVSRLDEPPTFQRVSSASAASRPAARPYTGTIPDYTADVEGLRLDGVLEGGPAQEAGLREGDIIVELAGSAIKDVYDYAKVLDTLEIDEVISVVVLREGERLETELTPRGRE